MGIVAQATAYKPTPPGTYRGRLESVEEKKNDSGAFWVWTFKLTEDVEGEPVEEEFRTLSVASSAVLTPKAKARQWVHNMIGRILADDEYIDFDAELVGRAYLLGVGIGETGRNTLNSIAPSKRKNGSAPANSAEAPQTRRAEPVDNLFPPATKEQVEAIYVIGTGQGMSRSQVNSMCNEAYGETPDTLDTVQAGIFIESLQEVPMG